MKVLLTSVGRRTYLIKYFKDALGPNGEVHVSNSDSNIPAFNIADYAVKTPWIHEDNYIDFLLSYCRLNRIDCLIPLFDMDLPILSKNKNRFADIGVTVVVSKNEVIAVCNDKWKTYLFLKEKGFKVPNTYINFEQVLHLIEEKNLEFPIVLKPRYGMGSIGIFIADNKEELKVFYNKVLKSIQSSYLQYGEFEIETCILFQEFISGQEFGLDVINDINECYQNTVVKKKLGMRSGETDSAEVVYNDDLKKIGEKISNELNHIGNLDVDVFEKNGEYYVLEMNARFGGGYPFSHMAGVNLPFAIKNWIEGCFETKDYLTEHYNITSFKDILPTKINNVSFEIKSINKLEIINGILKEFNTCFSPTISEKVLDLEKYSEKIKENANVIVLKNKYDQNIGFAVFYTNDIDSKNAYISFIGIKNNYTGLGLGNHLLKAIIKIAIEKGMTKIKLEVNKANKSAIKFYLKNNFQVDENKNENSLLMMRKLDS